MPFGIVTPLISTVFLQTLSIRPPMGKSRRHSFTTISRYSICVMALYVGVAWGEESGWQQTRDSNPLPNTPTTLPLQASETGEGEVPVPALPPLHSVSNLAFGSRSTRHRWEQPQHLPTLPYLVGQVCINLVLESLLHVGVGGQVIRYVVESGAGGLIASKDKDKSLGQNFFIA